MNEDLPFDIMGTGQNEPDKASFGDAITTDFDAYSTLQGNLPFVNLVNYAIVNKLSDIHLVVGKDPVFRLGRITKRVPGISSLSDLLSNPDAFKEQIIDFIKTKVTKTLDLKALFTDNEANDYSSCYTFPLRNHTIRCSIFRTRGRDAVSIRIQPLYPRLLDDSALSFSPHLRDELTSKKPGLYLVTGGPSCGKSSTLASVIQEFVSSSDYHIRVLEDPIEYDYKPGSGLLTQQWVNTEGDIPTYEAAVDDCLRQDVNVIAFGELRDAASIKSALFASTLNMVVIATIHAPNFIGAIQRILESFPMSDREGVLRSLQSSLRVVVSQTFVKNTKSGGGFNKPKKDFVIGESIKLDYESVVISDDIKTLLTGDNFLKIPDVHSKLCDGSNGNKKFL